MLSRAHSSPEIPAHRQLLPTPWGCRDCPRRSVESVETVCSCGARLPEATWDAHPRAWLATAACPCCAAELTGKPVGRPGVVMVMTWPGVASIEGTSLSSPDKRTLAGHKSRCRSVFLTSKERRSLSGLSRSRWGDRQGARRSNRSRSHRRKAAAQQHRAQAGTGHRVRKAHAPNTSGSSITLLAFVSGYAITAAAPLATDQNESPSPAWAITNEIPS